MARLGAKRPLHRNGSKRSLLPETVFPWSEPKRVMQRKGFRLTLFSDNSRLYEFQKGGYLILTPEGVNVLRGDPKVISRYLSGQKLSLTSGGNSNIYLVKSQELPLLFKEHHSGISAKTQMEHMRVIRHSLLRKKRNVHEVPAYYGAAGFSAGHKVRDLTVMEFKNATKVEKVMEYLSKGNIPGNKPLLKQLKREFSSFKKRLLKRRLPLTDVHEGNILTYYSASRRRFIFVVLDQ